MLERYLIEYCSPTLASLKTASLFTYTYYDKQELTGQLQIWNNQLGEKGIELYILREQENTALIYVCRKSRLENDLQRPGVKRFLRAYGYGDIGAVSALERLTKRICESPSFPHEIGIFLGYPLWDVMGFIRNAGQNSKYTGYWKVYCREYEAVKTFAKYNKCKKIYIQLWQQGRSVFQLTVA